jgi:hypothetical protein
MNTRLAVRACALAALAALTACGRQPQVQRVDLEDVPNAAELTLTASPDTSGAKWTITADGKGIDFGKPAAVPFLSLTCAISTGKAPPQLDIIRHAQSQPGAKALFAVLGNGITSRLKLDAALGKDGWRWEGRYPASSPELDVFTGTRDIEATLPGGGMLHVAGSSLPRDFIDWCRRNGKGLAAPDPASSPVRG